MGWEVRIEFDRPIDPGDVVAALGTEDGHVRQRWGWASLRAPEVWNPDGSCLRVSGSWYSAARAGKFAAELAKALVERGYTIVTVGGVVG